MALIAEIFGFSGSPQLASTKAIAITKHEYRNVLIVLSGRSVTLLFLFDKLFAVPGELAENFPALLTADENRAALSRQLKLQVFIF